MSHKLFFRQEAVKCQTNQTEDFSFTHEAVKYLEQIQTPKSFDSRNCHQQCWLKNIDKILVNNFKRTVRYLNENTI